MPSEKSKVKKPNKVKSKKPISLSMPKAKFDEVMELLNDGGECDEFFKARCSVPVQNIASTHRNSFKLPMGRLFEEARLCVMQRDWKNLAKILSITKPSRRDHPVFFPILVRYAVIQLAHNQDKQLMDLFVQGVTGCFGEAEKQKFFKSLTNNN